MSAAAALEAVADDETLLARVELVPIDQLRPDPDNPRDIADVDLLDLMQSIRSDPAMLAMRPVLGDARGLIYAGTQRFIAFGRLLADGWEPPWPPASSGPQRIPAVVGPVSAKLRAERAARDNGSWGKWNDSKLRAMLLKARAAGSDLQALGFDKARLEKLLRDKREKEPGNPPPTPKIATTQPGDLWQLGRHRILCADSTRPETIEKLLGQAHTADLVLMDPPYAIYGSSSGLSAAITDDRIVRPFFRAALHSAELALKLFGHAYVFCDWRSWPSWWEVARDGHLDPKNLIVWDKGSAGMGNNYANTHELVGFFHLMPVQHAMSRDRPTGQRQVLRPNIVRANRPQGVDRQHNAAKPLDLLEAFIDASSERGELVVDLFLGSGSTLIAAEKSDRVCYATDNDPKMVDVAVRWWERMTSQKAQRVPAAQNAGASTPDVSAAAAVA